MSGRLSTVVVVCIAVIDTDSLREVETVGIVCIGVMHRH